MFWNFAESSAGYPSRCVCVIDPIAAEAYRVDARRREADNFGTNAKPTESAAFERIGVANSNPGDLRAIDRLGSGVWPSFGDRDGAHVRTSAVAAGCPCRRASSSPWHAIGGIQFDDAQDVPGVTPCEAIQVLARAPVRTRR